MALVYLSRKIAKERSQYADLTIFRPPFSLIYRLKRGMMQNLLSWKDSWDMNIGQPERATQNRVIALVRAELNRLPVRHEEWGL